MRKTYALCTFLCISIHNYVWELDSSSIRALLSAPVQNNRGLALILWKPDLTETTQYMQVILPWGHEPQRGHHRLILSTIIPTPHTGALVGVCKSVQPSTPNLVPQGSLWCASCPATSKGIWIVAEVRKVVYETR